ncbi:hypothetical protein CONPUDRAFT_127181 [Coniophora puteana RWD-64-598 SS2]|uniref:C2H2-type domain-containing protein n=1 Tax=Coniophora puteana (strain RWD-64-598) TaxID=741705 RepID=A0A5M3MJE7_CONPW|nr:uncharacterized protein CONPUDRAFT_127181 [Coniophora puteana RWD-64-598 SS2]EIW79243.1 hypothetical protein CONPUDRAFT_127181 [Coniophora puteana RWD-64-598 SS2]
MDAEFGLSSECTDQCVVVACTDPSHPLRPCPSNHSCDDIASCSESSDCRKDDCPTLECQDCATEPCTKCPALDDLLKCCTDYIAEHPWYTSLTDIDCCCIHSGTESHPLPVLDMLPPLSASQTVHLSNGPEELPHDPPNGSIRAHPCMWATCTATFGCLDELIEHVNSTHLAATAASCHWGDCAANPDALAPHLLLHHLNIPDHAHGDGDLTRGSAYLHTTQTSNGYLNQPPHTPPDMNFTSQPLNRSEPDMDHHRSAQYESSLYTQASPHMFPRQALHDVAPSLGQSYGHGLQRSQQNYHHAPSPSYAFQANATHHHSAPSLQHQQYDPSLDHPFQQSQPHGAHSYAVSSTRETVEYYGFPQHSSQPQNHHARHSPGSNETQTAMPTEVPFQAGADRSQPGVQPGYVQQQNMEYTAAQNDVTWSAPPSAPTQGGYDQSVSSLSSSPFSSAPSPSAAVSVYASPPSLAVALQESPPPQHQLSPSTDDQEREVFAGLPGGAKTTPSSHAQEQPSADSIDVHECLWMTSCPLHSHPSSSHHQFRTWACYKTFPTSAALTQHIAEAHVGSGKARYECFWQGCNRNSGLGDGTGGSGENEGFGSKQKIMRHIQSHTGHRPFQCSVCKQNFSEAATLQQHMRRHTKEKPYACDYPGCGKAFAITGALTIHKRTHFGLRPFKCTYCDKAFAESSNLAKHLRTHTGARPYVCAEPGCGKSFARPDQLARHGAIHRKGGPSVRPSPPDSISDVLVAVHD